MSWEASLRQILAQGFGGTQGELRQELAKHGHEVNQSTISRAMQRLGAQKVDGQWILQKVQVEAKRAYQSVHEHVLSVRRNEVLLFIKTIPGSAHYVASYLDQSEMSTVLGTLAGDDSVMVMPASVERIRQCFEQVRKVLSLP